MDPGHSWALEFTGQAHGLISDEGTNQYDLLAFHRWMVMTQSETEGKEGRLGSGRAEKQNSVFNMGRVRCLLDIQAEVPKSGCTGNS